MAPRVRTCSAADSPFLFVPNSGSRTLAGIGGSSALVGITSNHRLSDGLISGCEPANAITSAAPVLKAPSMAFCPPVEFRSHATQVDRWIPV